MKTSAPAPAAPGSVCGRFRPVIVGIGNTLLGDEGIGVHVVRRLRHLVPADSGIELVDGGTLSFNLLPVIESTACLIAVDAADFGELPGSVHCLVGDDFDRFLGRSRHTAHEVGLRELLDMARLGGRLPGRRALVGVQPQRIDWGEEPTELVAAAIPAAADLALGLADEWCRLPPLEGVHDA